jgi:hypothetical protein
MALSGDCRKYKGRIEHKKLKKMQTKEKKRRIPIEETFELK